MKKKIITIAGKLGSGKSTTSSLLSEKLSYEKFSSGDFFRQVGLDRGLTLLELSKLAETDDSIDIETDNKVREAGQKENIILESRLAYHFVPESFKVYLTLDTKESAKRMFEDLENNPHRKATEDYSSVEEMEEKVKERYASEKLRYKKLYNVDTTDTSNFDLIIDTSKHSPDEVCEIIIKEYKDWLENKYENFKHRNEL